LYSARVQVEEGALSEESSVITTSAIVKFGGHFFRLDKMNMYPEKVI